MRHTTVREISGRARNLAKHPRSTSRGALHLTALLLSLSGILAISGCTGVASTAKAPSQQTQNTAAPAISVLPGSLTFGSVAVGGTVSQSVTISNAGGSELSVTQASTAVSGVTITGAVLPLRIAAGGQSTFNVVYSPKVGGAVSGMVSVMSDASTTPSTMTVSGTGVAATTLLNASAASLSFGNVPAGTSSTLSVTLANAGNSNVTISGVSIAGASVAANGVAAGLILAPGQSEKLNVVYSPLAAGNLAGSVTVTSNAANSPDSISLSGTGVQAASHSVKLSWVASTSAVTGYNIYRAGASSGPYLKQNTSTVAATQYTDSAVQTGQTYYYELTSVTGAGVESGDSTDVSATIP